MTDEAAGVRLQKYLSRCGVASRRASERLILAGRVCINGVPATELGTRVLPGDSVAVDGAAVQPQEDAVTIMLHKPAGYVSAMSDPFGRSTVAELVPLDAHPSLYHIGRLDRDTSGLLLFSTDGALGNLLAHPRNEVEKTYYALVAGMPNAGELRRLEAGVKLDGVLTAPARVRVLHGGDEEFALRMLGSGKGASGLAQCHGGKAFYEARRDARVLEVVIHEGRNRQVRNMCAAVGHPVIALHRQRIDCLDLGELARGCWRELTVKESGALRAHALGCNAAD